MNKPGTLKPFESVLAILLYEKGAQVENARRARIGFVAEIRREQVTYKSSDGRRSWTSDCLSFDFTQLGEFRSSHRFRESLSHGGENAVGVPVSGRIGKHFNRVAKMWVSR